MTDRLRKLDALFAERVLGRKTGSMRFLSRLTDEWSDEPMIECEDGVLGQLLPRYTRSLDAAWEGLNKCGDVPLISFFPPGLASIDHNDGKWLAGIGITNEYWPGDHPAEALVLACLRAVGVSEEELK